MYFTLTDKYKEFFEGYNLNYEVLSEHYEKTLQEFYLKYPSAQHISSYLYSSALEDPDYDEDGWFAMALFAHFNITLSNTNEKKEIAAEWLIFNNSMIDDLSTEDFIIHSQPNFSEKVVYIENEWYQEDGQLIDIAHKYDHNDVIYEKYKALEKDYDNLLTEFNKQSQEIDYINTQYKPHIEKELNDRRTTQNILYMGVGAVLYATASKTIPVLINYMRR